MESHRCRPKSRSRGPRPWTGLAVPVTCEPRASRWGKAASTCASRMADMEPRGFGTSKRAVQTGWASLLARREIWISMALQTWRVETDCGLWLLLFVAVVAAAVSHHVPRLNWLHNYHSQAAIFFPGGGWGGGWYCRLCREKKKVTEEQGGLPRDAIKQYASRGAEGRCVDAILRPMVTCRVGGKEEKGGGTARVKQPTNNLLFNLLIRATKLDLGIVSLAKTWVVCFITYSNIAI